VNEDQREVCRLSPRGDVAGRLNLYPADYGLAFACSLILYPLSVRLALRFAFPVGCPTGQTTGLPRSADVPRVGKVEALRRWFIIYARGVRNLWT
jgi:hypothetical protein